MPDTTGKIRAKQLDTTGITEGMLEKDWSRGAGQTRMAVVELRSVEPHGPNLDGKKRIDYVIESIEPVPAAQEDVVRRLQSALYESRPTSTGDEPMKGTKSGPALTDVAKELEAHIERDDDGRPTGAGVWDGNTDKPLTAVPDAPAGGYCPFPSCDLENDHDGDHNVPDDES